MVNGFTYRGSNVSHANPHDTSDDSSYQVTAEPNTEASLPTPLYKLYDERNRATDFSELLSKTFTSLKVTQREANFLEEST